MQRSKWGAWPTCESPPSGRSLLALDSRLRLSPWRAVCPIWTLNPGCGGLEDVYSRCQPGGRRCREANGWPNPTACNRLNSLHNSRSQLGFRLKTECCRSNHVACRLQAPECQNGLVNTLEPIAELRRIAAGLDRLDRDCYRRHAKDPLEPVLGLGAPNARWCFFGRDPGEHEVIAQRPFVGRSGQRVRAVMREVSLCDEDVFWMNTVPYKPKGNKAWSLAVQRQCQLPLSQLLARWEGCGVIALGEAAFRWFGMTSDTAREEINKFWKRTDRYDAKLKLTLDLTGSGPRTFILCAVPHPSAANARWFKSFPDLLKGHLCGQALIESGSAPLD
jgi:uracil-DNA glycosylase family 4